MSKQTKTVTEEITHTPGPWKAHLNHPNAVLPGHIIKKDDDVARPICLVNEGGGTRGVPEQIKNALVIAQAPELLTVVEFFVAAVGRNPHHKYLIARAKKAIAAAKGDGK